MTRPRRQSREMTSDRETSTTPKARNSQSRSVSEVTRVMRLPVFLREKKLTLRVWRCS
jgi:hypothetical protein